MDISDNEQELINLRTKIEQLEKENEQLKWEIKEMIKKQITPKNIEQSIMELRQTFKDWENKHGKLESIVEKACRVDWSRVIAYMGVSSFIKDAQEYDKLIALQQAIESEEV